jgi:hypothetical protein
MNDAPVQQQYYARTAHRYDEMHIAERDERFFSLSLLSAMIDHFELKSVLDVGSGPGRTLLYKKKTDLRSMGIEPVAQLRELPSGPNLYRSAPQLAVLGRNRFELKIKSDERARPSAWLARVYPFSESLTGVPEKPGRKWARYGTAAHEAILSSGYIYA